MGNQQIPLEEAKKLLGGKKPGSEPVSGGAPSSLTARGDTEAQERQTVMDRNPCDVIPVQK